MPLPLHQRISQWPISRCLIPGLGYLIVPRWKVSSFLRSIGSESLCSELKQVGTLKGLLTSALNMLLSQRHSLTDTGTPS